jgi:predicted 3-demethylubiquinone-9 3-methyltransferase (glyoxalase superfamily)
MPITPFLWFDGQAEQAAKFYVSVFKGSKKPTKLTNISRYTDVGPGPKGAVMTVGFVLDGQAFTALNGGPEYKFTPAISLVVPCDTQRQVDAIWRKLLAGGGSEVQCGWLVDKYGVSWQIVPKVLLKLILDKDRAKADRVMAAMMKMVKLEIAPLVAAAAPPPKARAKG